ncbi:L-lactate dehydrogenase [Curtobacterium sp. S6]|uniref:L-lactate dehydrogenase n=1 Tax=Curtobacterium sp. S6 TaxID=1479623 RepID=UPI0004ABC783|nr:L-lactate dehydrogenase [Curtobacterium sp. S6]
MNRQDHSSRKLGIVGAGGVGSALAYATMIRGSASDIALYDVDGPRAEAEALDISHSSLFAGGVSVRGGDDPSILHDSDMVVVTAGARQRPGQSRLELADANAGILSTMLPELLSVAPGAVFMLVTNPCDVLTLVGQRVTGLPPHRIFSSGTVIDSSRLRLLIGQTARVMTSSVHAMIIGEHGDSEFPLWSQANIGHIPIDDWTDASGTRVFTAQKRAELAEEAMKAAYRVINGKGSTNYAIGLAGARIVEAVLGDQAAILPVSTVLDGYHGLSDVALSVPSVVDRSGVRECLSVPMSDDELERLHRSAEALRKSVAKLNL